MIVLKVDYREGHLKEILTNLELPILIENLEIGDIIIESDEPKFSLIFERKTYADLLSSIKDGRYKEQKLRMLSNNPAHHCNYILEGKPIQDSIVDSMIYHTMYRDMIHIIQTNSIGHTADIIKKIYDKCVKNPEKFVATNLEKEYVANVKIKSKKCDNIDKATCFILQLCQIPGISHTIAKEIVKKYSSWTELLSLINNESDETKKLEILSSINMIGAKKAKKIIEYII
jgi:crossover junction endonuclease MUS81